MRISIRGASASDYDGIAQLHKQLHNIHVENRPDLYRSAQHTFDYEYYQTLLSDDAYKVLVAEFGTIAAYTILRLQDTPTLPILVPRTTLYMDDICVDENLRGRGIGTAVFQYVMDYGKRVGAVCLELNVLAFNTDAIEFYRRQNMKIKSIRMEVKIESQ